MITSTVIKLIANQGGSLPRTVGHLVQAAFLNIIHSVDPTLSDTLHITDQRRPYTVSPLRGFNESIRCGQMGWLRFTLLNGDLYKTMTEYLLASNQGINIRIGGITFAVVEILNTDHPWASHTTFDDLKHIESLNNEISIEFASPTVFKHRSYNGKLMDPFPSPELFFGSLATRWNDYIPTVRLKHIESHLRGCKANKLENTESHLRGCKIRDYARDTVVLSSFNIKTEMLHYKGHPQIGSVGQVTYLLKDTTDYEMIHNLNRLAAFAFYSGIGCKTAMGMGQVRRI